MPRIDESPEMNTIDDLLINQKEAIELLDKFFAFQTTRVSEMEEKLRVFQSSVRAEPEIYDILNAAFGKSNKFQTWLKILSPAQQDKVIIKLKKDPSTDMYMINLGSNNPIQLGNNADGYEATDYSLRTQSNWLKNQLSTESDESKINVAEHIETFIRDERVCVSKTAILRVLLTQFLNDSRVRTKDKESINTCLAQLDKHREAYEKLNLHEILNPADQTLEAVVAGFNKKYQSLDYEKYHKSIENLLPTINEISLLGDKYPTLPPSAELIKAANILVARPEKSAHLLSMSPALSQSASTADNRLASFNGIKDVDNVLHGKLPLSPQRKEAALNALLSSESLVLTYPEVTDQAIHHRSAYLENMLAEAFPTVFQKDNDIFVVVYPSLTFEIYKAVGLNVTSTITLLDPKKFNVNELKQLFYEDRTNPLWHMLIMIKPIDKSFTINHKIDACIEVIKHISAGELKLNNTAPLEQTRILSKYLLDLIKTPVSKTYTIEQQIKAHLEVIKLIKKGQFKIDDKLAIKQAEDVAKSALTIVDAHRVYSPEITQLFVAIKKETDLSMTTRAHKKIVKTLTGEASASLDQDKQSIQKQLKGFLEGKREITHQESSDTDSTHSDDDRDSRKSQSSQG